MAGPIWEKNTARKTLNNTLLEAISGMKTIRLFNKQSYIIEKLFKESIDFCNTQIKMIRITGLVSPLLESVGVLCLSTILVFSAFFILEDEKGLEIIFVFVLIFHRMIGPTKEVNKYRVDFSADLPMLDEILDSLTNQGLIFQPRFNHYKEA